MPGQRPPVGAREARFVAIATIVALAIRLLHWHSLAPYPWFDFLGLDAKYYDDWARRIIAQGLQGDQPYFMGPLYPHLLALLYAVFGPTLDAVRWVQVLLSAATVPLVHRLARPYGGPRVAMVAAGACAVYGPLVYYSTSILYPTITVFLAAALLVALREAAERRSLPRAAVAGLTMGVYALGRGNILLFAPFAFFWLVAAWGRPDAPSLRGAARWRAGLPAGLVLALATVVAISPATIHNLRTGDPTLLTTNGGLNFYIGNGPMASGGHETPVLFVDRPDGSVERIEADLTKDVECRTEAERATGRSLTYTEVSSFWFGATMDFIRKHPGTFVAKLVMKFSHFWSSYEVPQIEHFGYFRRYSLPLRGPALTWSLVGPLAVVGMALAWRDRRRWALAYLFVVAYSASIILFFVLARYRLPIVPALLPFAAKAAIDVVDGVRARRWAVAAPAVAGAVVVAWLMQANFYGIDESKGIAQILYRHGIVADARGDREAAIGHYRDALALKPEYDKAHLNLGVDLARTGHPEEGMQHLLRAEALDPTYSRAPFNRGALLEELGRLDEARAAYARAVEIEPRYLLARASLGEMEIAAGDVDAARIEFEAVLAYDGRWESETNPAARALATRGLAFLDDLAEAEAAGAADDFATSPALRRAELARVRGRTDEALDRLRLYFEGGGTCGLAYRSLGAILLRTDRLVPAEDAFRRAVEAAPRLRGARLGLAQIAAVRGDGARAAEWLRGELEVAPAETAALLEMGLVQERLLGDPEEAERWFERYRSAGGDPDLLASRRGAWAGGAR